jgi:hypothetical protein
MIALLSYPIDHIEGTSDSTLNSKVVPDRGHPIIKIGDLIISSLSPSENGVLLRVDCNHNRDIIGNRMPSNATGMVNNCQA